MTCLWGAGVSCSPLPGAQTVCPLSERLGVEVPSLLLGVAEPARFLSCSPSRVGLLWDEVRHVHRTNGLPGAGGLLGKATPLAAKSQVTAFLDPPDPHGRPQAGGMVAGLRWVGARTGRPQGQPPLGLCPPPHGSWGSILVSLGLLHPCRGHLPSFPRERGFPDTAQDIRPGCWASAPLSPSGSLPPLQTSGHSLRSQPLNPSRMHVAPGRQPVSAIG